MGPQRGDKVPRDNDDRSSFTATQECQRFSSSSDTDGEKQESHSNHSDADSDRTSTHARSGDADGSHAVPTISRTVSEVRDGFRNERDMERGETNSEAGTVQPKDPNLVTWDGPDDPQNPKNWTMKRKWAAVITVSLFTLISPVASSMVAPGLTTIGADLHIEGGFMQALVLSIFLAAYALGPLVWGPLSELYGRKIILQIGNVWFLLFNLGCALARTEGEMIAFRFLAGVGGSAPLAIGGGCLGDVFTAEQRGKAISIYSLMPLLGPAVGPIAGGWIVARTTWRWAFYATTIASGVIGTVGFLFLQETYAPTILGAKKKRLVKETGNEALRTEHDHPDRTLTQTLGIALTRPFRLLATQPIIQFLTLYMAFLYGVIYIMLSSFPSLFTDVYGESIGIGGLNYLSLGVGFAGGAQIAAPLQDRIYAALKRRYVPDGGPGRPEFRVPMIVPGAILVPVGLFIYGWTAQAKVHWIAPNIGAAIFAFGSIIGYQCLQGYVVDSYTKYAASAVGAVTVLRSLAGFGFPLFAPSMYAKLDYGWGNTLLACLAIVIGWPAPVLLWKYGPKLREKSQFAA